MCDNLLTMWITSLGINNFRCFEALSLTFKKGLNVFVGENSAGKSAVFVALSKLLRSTQQNPGEIFTGYDLRYGELKGEFGPLVQCELSLSEQEREQLVEALFSQTLPLADRADAHRLLAPSMETAKVVFEWQEKSIHTYVKLGPMFILNNCVSNQVRQGGSTHDLIALPQRLKELDNKLTLEEVLAQEELWASNGVLRRIGWVLQSYFKSFAEFRARPSSSGRSAVLESLEGSGTPNVLLNLKNHHDPHERSRYQTVRSEFSNFFPPLSIEAVEKEPGGQTADIQVIEVDRGYPIPLENVGAGVAELLTLLTNLVVREGYIFVIEEPEIHLHPHAKRRLLELIKESAKNNQIFIITHDQCFVDPQSLGGLILLRLTNRGTQPVSLADNLPPKALAQLKTAMKDTNKREVVFARTVLLVEDESQQRFILGCANALSYDLNSQGISVIPVDGEDGYKPFISLVKALNIPYLCLRDKPWGPSEPKAPEVYRALGCELEEFLEQAGLCSLIEKGRHQVGTGKARVAGYIGEHIMAEQVPPLFYKLISDAVKLSKER